jgi:thiol:disulfide interchange protein
MFSVKVLGGSMTVTTTDLRKPANRRPARRMTAMLAALTIVLAACSTSGGTDMPNYRTDRPTYNPNSDLTAQSYATTDQVLAAVAAAQQTQVLSDVAAAQLATYGTQLRTGTFDDGPEHCFD